MASPLSNINKSSDEASLLLKSIKFTAKDLSAKTVLGDEAYLKTPNGIKKELIEKLDIDRCVSKINTSANWLFSLCLTQDEKCILVGGHGDIFMIDFETRTVIHTFKKTHTSRINSLVATKTGILYSGSQDSLIKAWDLNNKTPLVTFQRLHKSIIYGLCLTADEKFLVSASADQSIRIWNLENQNKHIAAIQQNGTGYAYSVAVTKDNKFLIAGYQDRSIRVWNFGTWTSVHCFKDVHFGNVLTIKLSNDERMIYSSSTDGSLSVCDLIKKEHVHTFSNPHSNVAWGVVLTSDDRFLLSSGSDNTASIWDTQTKLHIHSFKGFDQDLHRLVITKDNRFTIATGSKGSVYITDFGARQESCLIKNAHGLNRINDLCITSDDRYIVTGATNGEVAIWNLEAREKVHVFNVGLPQSCSIGISANNNMITSGQSDGSINLYDFNQRKLLYIWPRSRPHTNVVSCVIFTKDASKVISCSYDSSICIHETTPPYNYHTIANAHKGWVLRIELTEDEKFLISSAPDKFIIFWNLETKTKAFQLENAHDAAIWRLKITHDGKYLVSSSIDQTIKVWDIQTRKKLHTMKTSHPIKMKGLTLSNDGNLIVSTDSFGILEIHNFKTKQRVYIDAKAECFSTVMTADNSKIIFTSANESSIHALENPFIKLTVQYSENCSLFSLLRFLPATSFFLNQNLDHRIKMIKSYPHLQIYPYGWNWFHIVAIYWPVKEGILACFEGQIPFRTDSFGRTPLHYLLDNENTFMVNINIILGKFDQILKISQRPSDLLSALSDILPKLLELDSSHVVSFLKSCVREPEPAFEYTMDVCGEVKGGERSFYLSDSLLYTPMARQNLLDKPTNQKVTIKMLPFFWNYSPDSTSMKVLVKTLRGLTNQEIFETKAVSLLTEYLWNSSKNYYYFLWLFFTIQTTLISLYTSLGETSHLGFEIPILIISIIFLLYEVFEIVQGGLIDHFSSIWNCMDALGNLLIPGAIIATWADIDEESKNWLFSFVLAYIYTRWVSYFRVFKQTRTLIRMIFEIIIDVRSFALVLAVIIVGLSLIFMQFDRETPYKTHLLNSYMLLYSNFDLEDISTGTMFFLLILIAYVCIVLLNMLIAIMGDTFGRVQEMEAITDSKEILELVAEYLKMRKILVFFKLNRAKIHNSGEVGKYLFYAEYKVEEEDSDQVRREDDINMLKEQLSVANQKVDVLQARIEKQQLDYQNQMQEQTRLLQLIAQNVTKSEQQKELISM